MTTEDKALALLNEVARERGSTHDSVLLDRAFVENEALCRAIEQREAFRQEVSDALLEYYGGYQNASGESLERFIIPKPKPDALVAAVRKVDFGPAWDSPEDYCNKIRAALDAAGFEIREKGND